MRAWLALFTVGVSMLVLTASAGGSTLRGTGSALTFVSAVPGGLGGVVSNWDPGTMYDPSLPALSQIYERLTLYNPGTRKLTGVLATSWSSSQHGKTWTFKLRKHVHFHTGRLLTSEAVKESILRTKKLNGPAAYLWSEVKSINTSKPSVVVFHLKVAQPLDLIASSDYGAFIYDTQAAHGGDLAKWFKTGKADAGTGPYTISSWTPGQQVELVLKADPDYWGGWRSNQYRQAVYLNVPDAGTAVQLANSGQVNYIQALTPQLWKTFKHNSHFRTPTHPSFSTLYLLLNTASGPLRNIKLRKAVAYGINYKALLKLEGAGFTRTPGIVPKGMPGYFGNLPDYTYKPGVAKRLVQQSGQKHVTLTLTYNNSHPDQGLAAGLVKSDLAHVGIKLNIRGLTGPAVSALAQSKNRAKRQDITWLYWEPDYPDGFTFFDGLFKSANPPVWNWAYYNSRAFDHLLAKSATLLGSKRLVAFRRLQAMLYRDIPGESLYTVGYARVLSTGVKGFVDNPSYPNVVFVYNLRKT